MSLSHQMICLFGVFRPTQECFTHMEIPPFDSEGLQIFTFNSWPFSSEGTLAYHTYCDMGHPFKMVISNDL